MSRRILLIEDDPISQDVIRSLLVGQGHDVDVVADGFSALERARTARYDAALIDYHLPEMDGYALGRLLCEQKPVEGPAPVLIGLTADRNGLAARRGSDAVFRAILSKPIKPADLFSAIDSLCAMACAQASSPVAQPADEPDAGRRATAALWYQHGLASRPNAFVCPPPTPEQAAALKLCFDLTGASESDLIVLLERHGLNEAIRAARRAEAERRPLVGLSADHGDICDMVFSVGDPDSWRMLAKLIGPVETAVAPPTPAARAAPAVQAPVVQVPVVAAMPPDRLIAPMVPMAGQAQPFPTLAMPAIAPAGLDLRALLLQGICAPLSVLRDRLQRQPAQAQESPATLAVLDDVMLMADAIADFVKAPGTHEPRADGFAPAELVENTVAMVRDVQGLAAPRLHCRVDPAVPARMRGEVHHLSQILLILVDDAASLPGGGVATLDIARSAGAGEGLTFSVTHQPAGEHVSHAGPDVTARLRSIRLATLGRLVTLIGGTLDLTGQAQGVLLRMTVPAMAEPAVSDPGRVGDEGPCNLVVIDDGGTGSQILTLFLTGAGHHVCRVGDANAAIFACQSARPDLVLFDVAGPAEARRDALSSARAFREVHSRIPMLVLAPALDESEQAELAALGTTAVLPKPFLPDALDLAIAKARRMSDAAVELLAEADAGIDALDRDARRALCQALGPVSVERLTGQLLGEIDSLTQAGGDAARTQDATRIVELSSCAAMLGLSELARLCAAFDARRGGPADRLLAGRAVRTALHRTQHALAGEQQAA